MNLAALMNDGDGEEKKQTPPEAQHRNSVPPTSTPISNGPTPMQYAPGYPPPSAGRLSGSQGLTPLQTPSSSAAPYSFPSSAGPGGSAGLGGSVLQYRAPDPYAATTPGTRPPSQTFPHPHPHASPLQQQSAGLPQSMYMHHPNSVSPTPSSHHSQHTPHSIRHSPLAFNHQVPPGQHPQHPLQRSQPSTPLGPPPLQQQRSAGSYSELASPYHQRGFSGASNHMMTSHSPSTAIRVESPSTLHRPPPGIQRSTSEYLSHVDRERQRSLSVSPKTKVPPRPPSMDSRTSSMQDVYSGGGGGSSSARSSGNQQTIMGAPHLLQQHVTPPAHQPQPTHHIGHVAQTQPLHHLNAAIEVSRPPPPPVHQSLAAQPHQTNIDPSEKAALNASVEQTSLNGSKSATSAPPPSLHSAPSSIPSTIMAETKPLKRPAEDTPAQEPPSKRKMTRKYPHPPAWAILSKHNPRYRDQQERVHNLPAPVRPAMNGGNAQPHSQPPAQPLPNGYVSNGVVDHPMPWMRDPPLDNDLINASQVMGRKWEKTFRWNTPYPDMLRAVQDWLCGQMAALDDVGWSPEEGAIEIEGKVGRLFQAGTTDRCKLPVSSATVIDPAANSRYQFESAMTQEEHQKMNEYLNKAIVESKAPGRVGMGYKHLYETDSFYELSDAGSAVIPEPISRRFPTRHTPRLRATHDTRDTTTKAIKACIVKLPVSSLHIYNPKWEYDCRISINLEVNLSKPGLDMATLVKSTTPIQGARVKDRLSYTHLVYSIDLTKVEQGKDTTYELELECDATVLRQQMALAVDGKPNALGDVVAGFLDNLGFLMRAGG